jgi:H+/Cl- antiporter ClcA
MSTHSDTTNLSAPAELGDFTAGRRTLMLSLLAVLVGAVSSVVAVALMKLIALFTNVFFYQEAGFRQPGTGGSYSGLFVILVPVAGAFIIGLMARYGSERIRGHGIPEPSRRFSSTAAGSNPNWPFSNHCLPQFRSDPADPLAPKARSS